MRELRDVPLRPAVVLQVGVDFAHNRQRVNAGARAGRAGSTVGGVPLADILRVLINVSN
jgi:hypothetical protein